MPCIYTFYKHLNYGHRESADETTSEGVFLGVAG